MKLGVLITFVVLSSLVCSSFAQTKEQILSGKYVVELQQWPEKDQLLKDWGECVKSLGEIKNGVAKARANGKKELKKKYLPVFEELCELALNEEAGDVAARLRKEKAKVIKKMDGVMATETLAEWDKRYAFCNKEVPRIEDWAEAISKAAMQFPDDFKGGTLRERMDAMNSEEAFGKPTKPSDYGALDSLIYADGISNERNTLLAASTSRKALYEKAKNYYDKGVHKEKVTSLQGRITRTIVYTELEFKVFEVSEPFPDVKFYLIDGKPVGEQNFLLEEAKYTRIGK